MGHLRRAAHILEVKPIVTTGGCDIKILSTNLVQKSDLVTDTEEFTG